MRILLRRAALCLRQGWAAVLLVVLGLLASAAVTVFMTLTPEVPALGCDAGNAPRWLVGNSVSAVSDCAWQQLVTDLSLNHEDVASVPLDRQFVVTQTHDGKLHLRLTASAPATSALIRAVARGEANRNTSNFVYAVWGGAALAGTSPDWQYPQLTLRPPGTQATIELEGTFGARNGTLRVDPNGPLALRVTLADQRIAAVRTRGQVTLRDAHDLSARISADSGALSLDLPAANVRPADDYASETSPRRILPSVWRQAARLTGPFSSAGGAALSAAGWCALLLAARAGLLGPPANDDLRRLIRLTGVVLMAHAALWTTDGMDTVLTGLSLPSSSWANERLPDLVGWQVGGYAPVSGAPVLLVCVALFVLPASASRLGRDMHPPAGPPGWRRRWVSAAAFVLGLAALGCAAEVFARLLDLVPASVRGVPVPAYRILLPPLVLFALLVVLSALAVLVARRAGWRLRFIPLMAGSAFVPLFAVGAELTGQLGLVPNLVRWIVPVLAGAVTLLATAALTATVFGPPRRPLRWLTLLFPVAAALAAVWHRSGPEDTPSWWDFSGLGVWLDAVGGLVLLAAALRALRSLSAASGTAPVTLRRQRALGIVLIFTAAAGGAVLNTEPNPAAVAAAAVMTWLLFPYQQIRGAAVTLAQTPQARAAALVRVVRSGTARRSLPSARKAARDAIAEGPRPYATAHLTLRALERGSFDRELPLSSGVRVSEKQLAFGGYIGPEPWSRALRTARLGAVIGAPWTVLSLAGAALSSTMDDAHPVLALIGTVPPILLTWTGFSLLYGYFFPLLRGSTGFAKALWLYGLIVVPTCCNVVTSPHPTHWASWTQTLLHALEALAFAMTLGLRADSDVLTAHAMRPARLAEVHNLGAITAWWSSVAVALAAGAATVVIAGLQPFLLDVFPQHASQPAPISSPPTVSATTP